MQTGTAHSTHNIVFWLHLALVLLALSGPFLFSWFLLIPAYGIVLIQFLFFRKCLMNKAHDLTDPDTTFYSYLFEKTGWRPDRKKVKLFVRRYLYLLLAAVAITWQVLLGQKPLLF